MGQLYRLDFSNGKSYIGITTKTAAERIHGHRCAALKGGKTAVQNAWRAIGEPTFVVLAELADEELYAAEIEAIARFGTLAPRGYNLTAGGDKSPALNPLIALKISASLKGKALSEKHKASLSAAKIGKLNPKHADRLRGRKLSDATKAKMSVSARSYKKSPEHLEKIKQNAFKARAALADKHKEQK